MRTTRMHSRGRPQRLLRALRLARPGGQPRPARTDTRATKRSVPRERLRGRGTLRRLGIQGYGHRAPVCPVSMWLGVMLYILRSTRLRCMIQCRQPSALIRFTFLAGMVRFSRKRHMARGVLVRDFQISSAAPDASASGREHALSSQHP